MRVPPLFGVAVLSALLVGSVQAGPVLWVNDSSGNIGTIDVSSGTVTVIGNSGAALTDIAFDPSGNLYGVSFTNFYSINKTTGLATSIGSLGTTDSNALVFSNAGVAYTMGYNADNLRTVNVGTGAATSIGNVSGFMSGGDLAFHNGDLYLATTTNALVKVGFGPVSGTSVGPFGVSNVFGLANGDNNVLYAVAGTNLYSVNAGTGALTSILDYSGKGLGQAFGQAFYYEATVVPEPSTTLLLALGLAPAWLVARRKKRAV